MKLALIALLATLSFATFAQTTPKVDCELDMIASIVDSKVGKKINEMSDKFDAAEKAGDHALAGKLQAQAAKVMTQTVELATSACE